MGFLEALDRSVGPLAAGLDRRSRRHAALAANVANADTPGYRAIDVPFAAALGQATATMPLAATDARHLQGPVSLGRDSVILAGGTPRRDGNDVDVDREMGKLAQNQIEYQFLTRALGRQFGRLREAITGRATV